jgi:hypothetical protein
MDELPVAERVAELLAQADSFARADDHDAARSCARRAVEQAALARPALRARLEGEARLELGRHERDFRRWQQEVADRERAHGDRERSSAASPLVGYGR